MDDGDGQQGQVQVINLSRRPSRACSPSVRVLAAAAAACCGPFPTPVQSLLLNVAVKGSFRIMRLTQNAEIICPGGCAQLCHVSARDGLGCH